MHDVLFAWNLTIIGIYWENWKQCNICMPWANNRWTQPIRKAIKLYYAWEHWASSNTYGLTRCSLQRWKAGDLVVVLRAWNCYPQRCNPTECLKWEKLDQLQKVVVAKSSDPVGALDVTNLAACGYVLSNSSRTWLGGFHSLIRPLSLC